MEDKIFLQLKKNMQEYDRDYLGAIKRAEEIAEYERKNAEWELGKIEVLEHFGVIL